MGRVGDGWEERAESTSEASSGLLLPTHRRYYWAVLTGEAFRDEVHCDSEFLNGEAPIRINIRQLP